MDLEELSAIWKNENNTYTKMEINEKLLKEVSFSKIRSNLKEIKWEAFIELFVNYFWINFLIEFIMMNFPVYKYIIPAGILLFIALFGLIIGVYKLILYYSINNQHSVLQAQQRLEKLKYLEIFDNNSLYIFIPLFFIPFIVVSAKGFIGLDLYEVGLSEREMLHGTAGSFLVAIIIVFLLNRFPNTELTESIEHLKELRAMQKE